MVTFWVALLAISILIYLLLDGFDLGVGILFLLPNSESRRRAMLGAIAPFWDGNETWLVVTGVILWGAFPVVYATVLSAFYIPVIFMLLGLILRGVAFEFRNKSQQSRWIWNLSFSGGSLVASFMQGVMVGTLVQGPADGEWRIYWRHVRLVQRVFGAVRHRSLPGVCAARRLLAGQEARRRGSRCRSRPDPRSRDGRCCCF